MHSGCSHALLDFMDHLLCRDGPSSKLGTRFILEPNFVELVIFNGNIEKVYVIRRH